MDTFFCPTGVWIRKALSLSPTAPQSASSSTVRHRSSRTSSQRQASQDRVAMEMEEATLVAEDDDPPGPDEEDSTWEAI